ncbi:8787_t:CDS:2 [Gigaspora margarita]|uniref:8787_t:CDS:1 n=1 Tax=Gigaspora margarita TaxID=4874 RepID=A0ABN7V1F8_GIGMA|nr:8787_t:CDS:2 [Gigaspora margarita]
MASFTAAISVHNCDINPFGDKLRHSSNENYRIKKSINNITRNLDEKLKLRRSIYVSKFGN